MLTLADDSRRMVPYFGPIEDMNLVVLPSQRRVDINPLNPNDAADLGK
jgi:hypothetical protein